ncbi:MAG: S-layer homology domain-containing protein [Oscillospiraceae bacterium]|jgi:hypothetical protein|nr:S-layer homology domain-containing protein [Oscillospiraceae bacterium]
MKKIIAVILAAALLLPFSLPVLAAELESFTDMPTGWSRDAVVAAVENGLLQGSNGKIDPQGSLTRVQMAAILVRAFGVANMSKAADLSAFTDVDPNAWYYKELSLAVGIGLLLGDGQGRLRPNDVTTREEVAVVLSRAFFLLDAEVDLSVHTDAGRISSWARDGMAALAKAGRLQGYPDGTLRPQATISREEFAQIMSRLVARYITEPGEYTFETDGAVVIRVPGVILKGCVIAGDLILGDDLVRADVTLENTVFVMPSGAAAAAPRLIVRAEENVAEGGPPPLIGPGDGEDGEDVEDGQTPGGDGSSTPTVPSTPSTPTMYTLNVSVSSPPQNVSTQRATGLAGDGEAGLLVILGHLRDNAQYLESQLTPSASPTGLFGPLFGLLGGDVTLDTLADLTALTQYVTVAPGSAADAAKWRSPNSRLEDLEGQSTLIFDDEPFYTEMLVDVGRDAGGYTLQVTLTGSVNGLTVGSSYLTGANHLYDNVFGSIERRLDALLSRYDLSADITAADYIAQTRAWFNNLAESELSELLTATQGSAAPLMNRDTSIGAVAGYVFTLRAPGFTVDVSVVR